MYDGYHYDDDDEDEEDEGAFYKAVGLVFCLWVLFLFELNAYAVKFR